MNYIVQLKQDNAMFAKRLAAIEQGIMDLRAYLQSSKFASPGELQGYVNVDDVDKRLVEIFTLQV